MASSDKPNILYMFADQLSMEALNLYGNTNKVHTPNIDYLAQNGLRFENSYCSTPQCSPSRSSLLTGLYPHKSLVIGNIGTPGTKDLGENFITMGSYFKKAGYVTGYFGKWHLGNIIERFGFDEVQCSEQLAQSEPWIQENLSYYEKWVKKHLDGPDRDEWTTDKVNNYIESHSDNPWLAMVSYENPHDIYFVNEVKKRGLALDMSSVKLPANHKDDLTHKPLAQALFQRDDSGKITELYNEEDWKYYLSYYYYLVEKLDTEVGRVIHTLTETGQIENTVIIFSSDHGDLMTSHGCAFKGPMMYNELIKTPLIISGASFIPKNKVRQQPVVNTDIFPTLCDLLGGEIPGELDGVSFKECIFDQEAKGREFAIVEYYSKQKWINPIRTIIKERYKYNAYLCGEEELYDLQEDRGELKNLALMQEYKGIKAHLAECLEKHIHETKDSFYNMNS